MAITTAPATAWSIVALANLFSEAFAGYFYPGITTPAQLARRIASENLNLAYSPVLLDHGTPIGLALLGLRGSRAWCGGFGIIAAQRGHGYAHTLMTGLRELAHSAGARHLSLEVLTRNTAALQVYERAGFRITRRLLILSWQLDEVDPPAGPTLIEIAPEALILNYFAAMHPVTAAWQREPATLLSLPGLRGLALYEAEVCMAYALVSGNEALRLYDFAARDQTTAHRLLAGLQMQAQSIISINEPATSPLTSVFLRQGFMVADEQHELVIEGL